MKLTITPSTDQSKADPPEVYPSITVEYPADDLTWDEVCTILLRPAFLAWGYSPITLDRLFRE